VLAFSDATLGGYPRIPLPYIGTDYRATLKPLPDKERERFGLNVRNHFCPYLAASAPVCRTGRKDAEGRGLISYSAPLGAIGSLRLSL